MSMCQARGEVDGSAWRCDRETAPGAGGTGDLCPGHYKQGRRAPGAPPRPLTDRTRRHQDAQVAFRLPGTLKTAALSAAKREGVDEGEWWRRAGAERVKRKGTS